VNPTSTIQAVALCLADRFIAQRGGKAVLA
jgi:hypothetical protein